MGATLTEGEGGWPPVLDEWMRGCLLLAPRLTFACRLPAAHPFYLWLLTIWVGVFGVI